MSKRIPTYLRSVSGHVLAVVLLFLDVAVAALLFIAYLRSNRGQRATVCTQVKYTILGEKTYTYPCDELLAALIMDNILVALEISIAIAQLYYESYSVWDQLMTCVGVLCPVNFAIVICTSIRAGRSGGNGLLIDFEATMHPKSLEVAVLCLTWFRVFPVLTLVIGSIITSSRSSGRKFAPVAKEDIHKVEMAPLHMRGMHEEGVV